jgi:phosphoenolpyruvate carboxylase
VSYYCQKETWSLNELISHCVQEEDRLKQDQTESAHIASRVKRKERRIRKLQVQLLKRNQIRRRTSSRLRKVLVVTFVGLKDIRRSIAPIIALGVLRKVCFSLWFVQR